MDSGKLLPDEIILEIIRKRFKNDDCKYGYLLDGFPRTLNQAQKLEEISPTDAAIYLKCNDDLLIKRLTGRRMGEDGRIYNIYFDPPPAGVRVIQRNDDREETIRERLRVFYETFTPVMDFYREKGLLYEIRGDDEQQKVFGEIVKLLESITP
jgi:adenylate kinase